MRRGNKIYYVRQILLQVKIAEMGETCSTHINMRNTYQTLLRKPEPRNHVQDVLGKILLYNNIKKDI